MTSPARLFLFFLTLPVVFFLTLAASGHNAAAAPDESGAKVITSPALTDGPARFELRGLLIDGTGPSFHLHDRTTGVGDWVRLHEFFSGFQVARFSSDPESITLLSPAGSFVLTLPASKVSSLDSAVALDSEFFPDFLAFSPEEQSRLRELARIVARVKAKHALLEGPGSVLPLPSPVAGKLFSLAAEPEPTPTLSSPLKLDFSASNALSAPLPTDEQLRLQDLAEDVRRKQTQAGNAAH